jgi:hypothetical protein
MEIDYEKDVRKILGMLEYDMKSFSYEYEDILRNMTMDEPWRELYLSIDELESYGINENKARQLFFGVCRKQGLAPYDFMDTEVQQIEGMDGEEHIVDTHSIRKSKDGKYLKFPAVHWISDVIKNIENNTEELQNPELYTKHFDGNNTLTLNGLTGEFSYNKISDTLTLRSRKLQLLRALLKSKTNSVTYNEMAKMFFDVDEYNKAKHSKAFSDVLDDLKRDLGILPKTDKSNPDCFQNNTKTGYRLSITS